MNSHSTFTFRLTQCYLEVARSAMTSFHHPTLTLKKFLEMLGHDPLTNAVFSAVSISVLYSYLSIESFVNYQLYRIWERRNDGSPESDRFLKIIGNVSAYQEIKTHRKVKELGERIKTVCDILGYRKPHEAIPTVWQDFKELIEVSRHFFVHPHPGKEHFQNNVERIFMQTQTKRYVHVAEELLKYLYQSGGKTPPDWLDRNRLLNFKGINILVGAEDGEERRT